MRIKLALLVFSFVASAQTVDEKGHKVEPHSPYEWGKMQVFHNHLDDQTSSSHYHEQKTYFFKFPGALTTFNVSLEYEKDNEKNNTPCIVRPRRIKHQTRMVFENENQQIGQNYVGLHAFQNKVIVITSHFEVQVLKIMGKWTEDFKVRMITRQSLPQEIIRENSNQQGTILMADSLEGKFIHIFLPNQIVSFEIPHENLVATQLSFSSQPYVKDRSTIFKAAFFNRHLYLACGEDGIDVYRFPQDSVQSDLEFVTNLNEKTLNLKKKVDARDIQTDDFDRLYILDYNNGVVIYSNHLFEKESGTILLTIPILAGSSKIGVRGDHTLVATGHFIVPKGSHHTSEEEKVYFIKEVFFDIDRNAFFVNREFSDKELKWKDITMGNLFTYVQGKGVHRIFFQGVNNQLFPQSDSLSDFRNGLALQEFEEHEISQTVNLSMKSGDNYFIGIGQQGVYSIVMYEVPPSIQCMSNEYTQEVTRMHVTVNSTDCEIAQAHNPIEQNLWSMCTTDFNFIFKNTEVYFDESNISLTATIIILSILFMAGCSLRIYVACRARQLQLQKQEVELSAIKNKYVFLESQMSEKVMANADKSSFQMDQSMQQHIYP